MIGSDDFRIRVSPDGSEWRDALLIERASGVASFPCGVADVPRPNLLVNAGFLVNQRRFAGGSLAAGSYGFDRWRAGPSGCTLNRAADGTITLSGAVEQVVDVAQAVAEIGIANFAGAALTLSMEDLSAPLPVLIGTKAATIPAGSGRRSASVTLEAGETGNVLVRLQPAGTCTFKRMKLEVGSHATAWAGTPLELEEFRCRRTFQRLPVSTGTTSVLLAVGQRIGGTMIDLPVALPVSLQGRSDNRDERLCLVERFADRQSGLLLQQQCRELGFTDRSVDTDERDLAQCLGRGLEISGRNVLQRGGRRRRASAFRQPGLHRPAGGTVRIARDRFPIAIRECRRSRAAA